MAHPSIYLSPNLLEIASALNISPQEALERALSFELAQTLPLIRMTPRVRSVIKSAAEEAQALGHDYIGTEHLLLGLLADPDAIATQVLRGLNVAEDARERLLEVMSRPEYREGSYETYIPNGG